MEEPKPEQFGYQEAQGFDGESGWMLEGGEEAYYQALEKWNEVLLCYNYRVRLHTRSRKGKTGRYTFTIVSGFGPAGALEAGEKLAKKKGTVLEVMVLGRPGINYGFYKNRPGLPMLTDEEKAALWQAELDKCIPVH